jgi:hypothetical protein
MLVDKLELGDGYAIITAFTSATVVAVEILLQLWVHHTTANADWSLRMHFLQQQVFLLAYHSLNKD